MTPQPLTDSQIHAAFQARSAGSPSPDLAERIQSAARATGQQRPLMVLPGGRGIQPQRLLWAAAISATSLALVGGLIFAGRQNDDQAVVPPAPTQTPSGIPDPTPSAPASEAPSPSVEPTPSVGPSEAPSEVPVPVDPGLGPNVAAITLADGLRVRSLPTVGESSDRLEPLLPAGTRLYVVQASVLADGYAWYQVIPLDSTYPTGWVAAGSRDGEPWIGSDDTSCPASPITAAEVSSLGEFGGVACFGGDEIQVTGEITCDVADIDYTINGPTWMRPEGSCSFVLDDSQYYFYPDDNVPVGYPTKSANAVVSGHFSDTQSSSCEYILEPPAPDPEVVRAMCRAMFVATDIN